MATLQQRKTRRRRRSGVGRVIFIGFALIAITFALAALSAVAYVLAVASSAPELSELKPIDKGQSSLILAADGSRLGYVQSDEIRTPVPWRDMPVQMRQAVIAIEDERFYEHKGVDYGAIIRAGIKNLRSGDTVQGGSTITQQLVRALYIKDPKRTFKRKIREAKLASELEKKRSKRWILQNYLNDIPFGTVDGRTAIGIEAAAETFFNKHARDLRLHEAAMLAGLPQAPSQYNPFRNPAQALIRRSKVLDQMVENKFITRSEAIQAKSSPLGLKRGTRYTRRREPYFFDFVQEQLIEEYGVGVYRRGGLKVHTTINPKLQDAARNAINQNLPNPSDPSSAIVSVDPANGYIRAMASSGTYKDRRFNLAAQGHRQPGSAFKTMVLLAAITRGFNPASTTYVSRPLSFNNRYGSYTVKTYGGSYGGAMNLVQGTLKSDNTVYAQLILDVGPGRVAATAKKMGIETKLNGYPAEGLGGLTTGVSPLEMANAYATLASGGMRNEPKGITKVEFPDGKDDNDIGKPERERAFSDGEVYEVTKILKQNVTSGTGTRARIGCNEAGKTGTTDKFNDAWFAGYTPNLSTATWVGFPNALQSMPGMAGGTVPASIWHDYMVVAKGSSCPDFPQPSERVDFSRKLDRYSRTGRDRAPSSIGRSYSAPTAPAAPTNPGSGNYDGYDPRLYEAPPQAAPTPVAPTPTPPAAPEPAPDGEDPLPLDPPDPDQP